MKKALALTIGILFVAAFLVAFIKGYGLLAFICMFFLAGLISMPVFALIVILDNQDTLMAQLSDCRAEIRGLRRGVDKPKSCLRCGKAMDIEYTSCPYCGCREFEEPPSIHT